jgi:hypothetical protein
MLAAVVSTPGPLPHVRPTFGSTCMGYCHYPTNAGKVFRWGNAKWDQEFQVGSLGNNWQSNHPGLIRQQGGMLTLDATQNPDSIIAWPDNQAATVGRWEARVRAREFDKPGDHYRYTWELVPANGDDSCGANRIVLATYVPGDTRVQGSVNTLPDHSFTFSRKRALESRDWHTYAIEITRHRISWFVDTRVMRTERRPAALAGVKYRPEFVMQGVPNATMKPSLMQMDWVRYFTLERPDAKPITAPQMNESTVAPSC